MTKLLTDADRETIAARLASAPDGKKDFHQACASEMFEVAYDAVTPDQRDVAKTANFLYLYGSAGRKAQDAKS